MQYICTNCGETFDTPYRYNERHGFTHGPFENFSVCPHCGDPGYEPCKICDNCGKPMAESEANDVVINGHNAEVCNKCYDDIEDV